MYKIFFILIYLLLIPGKIYAFEYDPLLIRAKASIFPKIILLDKDIDSKLENNKVVIKILHAEENKNKALTKK